MTTPEQVREYQLKCRIGIAFQVFLGILANLFSNTVKTMFMKGLGVNSYAYSYILIGIFCLICVTFFVRYVDRVKKSRLLFWFSFVHLGFLIAARVMIGNDTALDGHFSPFFAGALILLTASYSIYFSLTTAVWALSSEFFRPRESKAMFPLLSAGRRFGGIIAGLSIPFFVFNFGVANLLIISIIVTICMLALSTYVSKRFNEVVERPRIVHDGYMASVKEVVSYITISHTVKALIAISLFFIILASLVDFQYVQVMSLTFKEPEALSSFFAHYSLIINILIICLQVLVGEALLLNIGVFRGLFVLPIVAALSFAWLTFSFTFWPALLMNAMWDIVTFLLQNNALQLSFNVAPRRLRGRIRGIIDGYAAAVGQIAGSLILIGIQVAFGYLGIIHFTIVSVIAFVLSIVWFAYVAYGRRYYIKDLVRNLYSENRATLFDAIESMEERSEQAANQSLLDILHSHEPRFDQDVKAKVMEQLARLGNEESLRVFALYIKNPSPFLRRAAVKAVNDFKALHGNNFATHFFNEQMKHLFRNDPEGQVRLEAGKYLINHMPENALPGYINGLLHDPDRFARISVIEAIGKLDMPLVDLMQFELLDDVEPSIRAAAAINLYPFADYREHVDDILNGLLNSDSSEQQRLGLLALIKLGGDRRLQSLVERYYKQANSQLKSLAILYYLSGAVEGDPRRSVMVEDLIETLEDPYYTEEQRGDFVGSLKYLSDDILDELLSRISKLSEEKRTLLKRGLDRIAILLYERLEA